MLIVVSVLEEAAKAKGLKEKRINEVLTWDGEGGLLGEVDMQDDDSENDNDDDSDNDKDDDDNSRPREDPKPTPPGQINAIYEEATPAVLQWMHQDTLQQAQHAEALITEYNKKIIAETAKFMSVHMENEDVNSDTWTIQLSLFKQHLNILHDSIKQLEENSRNKEARKNGSIALNLIHEVVEAHHYPAAWHLKEFEAKFSASIEYPWATLDIEGHEYERTTIIGVRKHGWGRQVCVERLDKEGRCIRTLEAASRFGLMEVDQYERIDNHKVLSADQDKWSHRDRDDFEELLWVTKSQGLLKNTAAGRRDPPADCCVRFKGRGLKMLTVSSLSKVLGKASAKTQIKSVCKDDGILPPWSAGYVNEYHDKSAVAKSTLKRRDTQDTQANAVALERAQSSEPQTSVDGDLQNAQALQNIQSLLANPQLLDMLAKLVNGQRN